MVKQIRKDLLLLGILAAAFVYRLALTTMNTFPPGADIGLHESVIKSITSGKTNFFWNNYHMGGGLSVTNPGYHIFSSIRNQYDRITRLLGSSFDSVGIFCAHSFMRVFNYPKNLG